MAYRVVFAPEARSQLEALTEYISTASSPDIAFGFVSAIIAYCEGLERHPRRGTKRDDLRSGLRTVGFRRRVTIAFDVDDETVTILGVFYGGQDFETKMRLA
jgi:plasmid stabilization system protein ParE